MWHLHDFLLPCIRIEENFSINLAFIFKFYFVCFAFEWNYLILHLLSIIFQLDSHISPESGCSYLIFTNKLITMNPELWNMNETFKAINLKFKIRNYLSMKGLPHPSTLCFKALSTWMKYVKPSLKLIRNRQRIFGQTPWNRFD